MNTKLKAYSKQETREIKRLFKTGVAGKEEREAYALSIGRTYTQISSKASYEKNFKKDKKKTLNFEPSVQKQQKSAVINVTHIEKTVVSKEAIIKIGEATISIPSKTFYVDSVKIDW